MIFMSVTNSFGVHAYCLSFTIINLMLIFGYTSLKDYAVCVLQNRTVAFFFIFVLHYY